MWIQIFRKGPNSMQRTRCAALGFIVGMLILAGSVQAGQSEPGLFAEYFNDDPNDPGYPGSYDSHFKTILLTQIESIIDFPYGGSSPSPAIRGDFFSARWSGLVIPPETGNYRFQTLTD